MQYVGLDVHSEATAISVRSSRGKVVRRHVVATTSASLRRVFLKTRGKVQIVCEAGPLARWIRDTLETRLREVIVCDRRRTRLVAGGSKNDKIDADKLSELLWKNELRAVYVPRESHVILRRLAGHYLRMVRERSRILFRVRALFLESGIRVVMPRSVPGHLPVHRLRDAASKYVARAYLTQLETTITLLESARSELIAVARTFPAFSLLQTVPYIGEIRAAQLIAIVGDPSRFRSRRRFWSYGALGLIQRTTSEHRVSNGKIVREERSRGVRLARTGQPLLKKILRDMAMFSSLGRGAFREVYDRHIARGVTPSTARLSLARKIAAVIRAVWKSGAPFDASLVHSQIETSGRVSDREFGLEQTRAAKAEFLTICRPEVSRTRRVRSKNLAPANLP